MKFFIPGPAGRLEALFWAPPADASPRAAAVVCHPHPLGGGTLDTNVVFRTARGLQHAGLAVLRFNFRGVGGSEGVHDGNGAEEGDASAALDWLAGRYPGVPLWGAGFSFGARTIASLAGRDRRLARVLCVTMPCLKFDCSFLRRVLAPTHVLTAGNDEYGNLADLRARIPDLPAHVDFDEIPGVDHFFRGKTPELEARVLAWSLSQFSSVPGPSSP
jgi:alpha/beta superfamily hydrolase